MGQVWEAQPKEGKGVLVYKETPSKRSTFFRLEVHTVKHKRGWDLMISSIDPILFCKVFRTCLRHEMANDEMALLVRVNVGCSCL